MYSTKAKDLSRSRGTDSRHSIAKDAGMAGLLVATTVSTNQMIWSK